jgi:hypothetical protein
MILTNTSGDVHLAAIGQFFSNPKLGIPKDRDFRYMPNVISSAIVNIPPPNAMADILNRRNKIHHLDENTDEDMIPLFEKDVNSTKRNNKRLMPRRNWCSIREYDPEASPPSTPSDERSPSPPRPRKGLLRRFSSSQGPSYRPDAGPPLSRPPISSGLTQNFSLRGRPSTDSSRPMVPQRSLSLSGRSFNPRNLFRSNSKRRPDDGGINGYGADSDEDNTPRHPPISQPKLRGGAGDESYFPSERNSGTFTRTRVGRSAVNKGDGDGYTSYDEGPEQLTRGQVQQQQQATTQDPPRRAFHRTPTGMSEKQRRKLGANHEVNVEGGLEITLNVEVNQRDPAGITVPYRLLVPALWYDLPQGGLDQAQKAHERKGTGLSRLMSFGRGKGAKVDLKGKTRAEEDYENNRQ